MRVRLKDVREPARVRRVLGNDRFEVEAGFMKMQVSIDDVIEVLPETGASSGKLPQERVLQAGAGTGARCTRRSTSSAATPRKRATRWINSWTTP